MEAYTAPIPTPPNHFLSVVEEIIFIIVIMYTVYTELVMIAFPFYAFFFLD